MRKVISLLMIFASLAFVNPIPVQAQFQSPSAITTFSPATVSVTATCTTTGCPTFTLPPVCTATVRLAGTNSAVSVIAQVSNDSGANFSPVVPVVTGTGLTAPNGTVVATTGAMTQSPGLYVIQLPTYNRVRFIVGTLTGTNVTITLKASSACNGGAAL